MGEVRLGGAPCHAGPAAPVGELRLGGEEAGLPMQGTAIIMRSAAEKEKSGSEKQPTAVETKTAVTQPTAKKRSPWIWVGIGLVVLLCLAIVGLTIRTRLNRPAAEPAPAATSQSAVQPLPDTPLPKSAEQSIPPEVTMAIDLVTKNPNDADAHLTLALALFDIKDFRLMLEELEKALTLAGPDNREFLLKAADKFAAREACLVDADERDPSNGS